MSKWDPEKYLVFQRQRTQPAIDLAKRVADRKPDTIADIGCGPGNSTAVLKAVFPDASSVLGIDNSTEMIERARKDHKGIDFAVASAAELSGSYDLLFSNACLQWIPDHEQLIPQLMAHLTDGGALAVQIPMNQEEPLFRAIHAVVSDGKWGFSHSVSGQNKVLSPDSYFNILSGCSTRFEMWETVYYHALPSHEHLMQWVRETRLRPYLSVLEAPEQRSLEQEILDKARDSYPVMGSGEIILRFRRFFFIACKN